MKLKIMNQVMLAAVMVTGSFMVSQPAQAASLTGTLDVTIFGAINNISGTSVDFDNTAKSFAVGANNTGDFASYSGGTITLSDLPLAGGATPFLTLQKTGLTTISFNLFSFNLTDFEVGEEFVVNNIVGAFTPGNTPSLPTQSQLGAFKFDPLINTTSIAITAIPTPALLPGIIGLGLSVLRQRRSASQEFER